MIYAFFSGKDEDLSRNAAEFVLNTYPINKKMKDKHIETWSKVFPEAKKFTQMRDNPSVVRECANLFSSVVMLEEPHWAVESFASFHAGENGFDLFDIFYSGVKTAGAATMGVLSLFLVPWAAPFWFEAAHLQARAAKGSVRYLHTSDRWLKTLSDLNEREQLLISAFPPKKLSQRDRHLKGLEEYISL